MSPCHPFRPVPGQCGPNRRGPLPAPPFDPRDYWATKKFVSSLFESIETKIDKFDVVDPSAEAEAGKAADAKGTYEELGRIIAKLAEKADKTALDDKRDKDDLAVYDVVRTENTDWTWTSENKELADELNAKGSEPVWIAEEGFWDDVSPLPESFIFNGGDFSSGRDSLVVTIKFSNGYDDQVIATARRPRYMDETLGQAKTNQQLAAIATGDAQTPANGDLLKYDAANNRLAKAVAGTDYRDPQDNTCHKTEYGNKWIASNPPEGLGNTQPYYDEAALYWVWWSGDHVIPYTADGAPDAISLTFSYNGTTFTATRSAVCSVGKRFVTEDVIFGNDGKPSDIFATDLLGKHVAKEKVGEIIAERVSELDPDNASVYDLIKALKGE